MTDTCTCRCSSYGEHLRRKNIGYAPTTGSAEQKNWDREIQAYRSARRQGIQPATTRMPDVQAAVELSDAVGKPFSATDGGFGE